MSHMIKHEILNNRFSFRLTSYAFYRARSINSNFVLNKNYFLFFKKIYKVVRTVTSRLFPHIVSTEKSRKEMRDRKDTRGVKHTYYNGSFFFILLLVKSRLRTFRLLTICLLYLKI